MRKSKAVRLPLILLVCGVGRGGGATHTAMSLAKYYASYERRRVCYVQLEDGRISGLFDFQEKQNRKPKTKISDSISDVTPGFWFEGIFFIPDADCESLKMISKAISTKYRPDFDVVVCDFSGDVRKLPSYMSVTDKYVFVPGLRSWRASEVYDGFNYLYSLEGTDISQGIYCVFSASKAEKRKFVSEYGATITQMPFISDPFALSRQDYKFLGKLVSRISC